jgi:hypothetical protein
MKTLADKPSGAGRSSVSFLPVSVRADLSRRLPSDTIEIELPGRGLVRVGPEVPPESLTMVINVLEGQRC